MEPVKTTLRRVSSPYLRILLIAGSLVLCSSTTAIAGQQLGKVTVAYLYQISKFVHWPAGSFKDQQSALGICYVGKDDRDMRSYLNKLSTRTSRGRPIAPYWFADPQAMLAQQSNGAGCHILFFAGSEWRQLSQSAHQRLAARSLLIGSSHGFLENHGLMALIPVKSRLSIFVNLARLKQSPLELEARLLALAKTL